MAGATLVALADESERSTGRPMTNGSSMGFRETSSAAVYVSPAGGRIKFQDYAEEWRARQIHRSSTASQIEAYLLRHAYPTLGAKPLGSIRRADLQAWVQDRSTVLAPGSVELIYRCGTGSHHGLAHPTCRRWHRRGHRSARRRQSLPSASGLSCMAAGTGWRNSSDALRQAIMSASSFGSSPMRRWRRCWLSGHPVSACG